MFDKTLKDSDSSLLPQTSHCSVFGSLAIHKNGGRRPGTVNNINVYLGRWIEGGALERKSVFEAFPRSISLSVAVPNIHKAKKLLLTVQDKECMCKMSSFFQHR